MISHALHQGLDWLGIVRLGFVQTAHAMDHRLADAIVFASEATLFFASALIAHSIGKSNAAAVTQSVEQQPSLSMSGG